MEYPILENLDFGKLHWSSDWNADEVGYDDRNVVGLYHYHELSMYIDMETDEVLEIWFEE